jgi:hypothetical protein
MKFKTLLGLTLVLFTFTFFQCASKKQTVEPGTVKAAEKILADQRAKVAKDADKVRKEAMKRHLKMQTKPVRKSIKRNAKAQKKRDKNIQYRKTAPLFNQ